MSGVLLGALALSCGGGEMSPATGVDAGDAGESGSDATPNACGGSDALAYQGSPASPADRCGPCLDGVLVCAAPNLLACSGARAASACLDASADSGTEAAPSDAGAADGATDATPTDAADASDGGSADGGDATATDAWDGAADASTGDAAPANDAPVDVARADVAADAPADASAYDGGTGWQSVDGGPAATALGDGGLPAVQCLPLATSDLVVDATRTVLYASVTSTSASFGNSVVRIDPAAVAVSATVFAGSNPGALALSDDASSLYVGLNGTASVMRIDPATGLHDPPVYLGSTQALGPRTAGQIAAVPGSSTRYVVSRRNVGYSPSFAGLALYDGASLLGEWNAFVGGESIAFVSSTTLYGYNNEDTAFDLFELTLTSTGFQVDGDATGVVSGFNATIKAQGGWVFATTGKAVVGATSQPAGQFPASGPVWPAPDGATVWFLTSGPTLDACSRATFLSTRSIGLPAGAGGGNPQSLDGWSSTGFVFRTTTSVCIVTIAP